MKNTFIFDLDGTLVNSLDSIAYFANKSLNKFGYPSIPVPRYKILVGNGAAILVQRMLAEVGGNGDDFEALYADFVSAYDNNYMYLTEPYRGIMPMLKDLKARGCKIAILSNKPHSTTKKICQQLFGDLVDVCYGKREGYPVKPDPKSVFEIIDELKALKEQCVYCGDTITDMETGKNAGLYTIGVLWGFRDIDEIKSGNPDLIVSHPSEISDVF